VRLGGRLVHLTERAGRRPPVLLLGGCGVPSPFWQPVVELLPDRHVVLLDRPGLLGSPWPGRLPTLAEEVATLTDLVQHVGGSIVVVAHSMAGPHAEALVRTRPEQVLGLVLVDGSVEWRIRRPTRLDFFRRALWRTLARSVQRLTAGSLVHMVTRWVVRLVVVKQSRLTLGEPPPGLDALAGPDATASILAEQGAYLDQLRELEQLRRRLPWPGRPTVVLTAAGDGGFRWLADQRQLADLLGAPQVVVGDARHLMMLDSPALIVRAVEAVTGDLGQGLSPDGRSGS
jgi:pimeloyl-ACP methyl ester carboxylesterase